MIRRVMTLALSALLLAAGIANAAAPSGPRLAVTKLTWKPMRHTLLTVDPHGGTPFRLAGGQKGNGPVDSLTVAPLSWKPDGTEVAYTGLADFFLAGADGSGAHPVNVADAELPVFAPDGHTIAFARGPMTWTIDLADGVQRQLTPLRHGLRYFPSSFSPDGKTLLATRVDKRLTGDYEPVALHLETGGVTRLLGSGREPVYSPDGTKVALFRDFGHREIDDLFVLDLATGSQHRFTRTPHKDEMMASWDPSGERIAFARFRGQHYDWADSIIEINADGSCETEVLSQRRTVYYSLAWQPGPGREAGPIDC